MISLANLVAYLSINPKKEAGEHYQGLFQMVVQFQQWSQLKLDPEH